MSSMRTIITALAAGVAIGVVAGMHLAKQEQGMNPDNDTKEEKDFVDILKEQFKKGKDKFKDIEEAIVDIITDKTASGV